MIMVVLIITCAGILFLTLTDVAISFIKDKYKGN